MELTRKKIPKNPKQTRNIVSQMFVFKTVKKYSDGIDSQILIRLMLGFTASLKFCIQVVQSGL